MTWELKKGTYNVKFNLTVGDKELTRDTFAKGLLNGWITVEWPDERESFRDRINNSENGKRWQGRKVEREEGEESNGSGSEAS